MSQLKLHKEVSGENDDLLVSARAFNKLLHELGVQYCQNGIWLLYADYENLGYTTSITSLIEDKKHGKTF